MKKLFISALLFIPFITFSQGTVHRCGFDELNQLKAQQNPAYRDAMNAAFDYAKNHSLAAGKRNADSILRIPVVVHVVYKTSQQNLPDSLIHNQIAVLNRDYRRQNADTANTRSVFNGLGADAGIEFYLACLDPDGNPTTGITRTQTTKDAFSIDFLSGTAGVDAVKFDSTQGKSGWDPNRYLNIWVCNTVDANSFFGAVLGLAYPPQGAPNWPPDAFPTDDRVQGLVIHYEVFGFPNPYAVGDYAIADQGRTVNHEVGHYLGLRHIWGDGQGALFGGVDCTADDGIADTPNSGNNSQTTGCSANKNTCNDGVGDLPDMWENYMDYSEETCQNIFTQGQVDIMRSMILTVRSGLLEAQCIDSVSAGILKLKNTLLVNVYPNPSSGLVHIDFGTSSNDVEVMVTDVLGNLVAENFFAEPQTRFNLNLSGLNKGIYFVRVQQGQKASVKRIVLSE
jgi:hypothetical protein